MKKIFKEAINSCVVVLVMAVLFVSLAWILGFTPDGISDGHWPQSNDHPTNWLDAALHPDAR